MSALQLQIPLKGKNRPFQVIRSPPVRPFVTVRLSSENGSSSDQVGEFLWLGGIRVEIQATKIEVDSVTKAPAMHLDQFDPAIDAFGATIVGIENDGIECTVIVITCRLSLGSASVQFLDRHRMTIPG